jgi:hypothetical protein
MPQSAINVELQAQKTYASERRFGKYLRRQSLTYFKSFNGMYNHDIPRSWLYICLYSLALIVMKTIFQRL